MRFLHNVACKFHAGGEFLGLNKFHIRVIARQRSAAGLALSTARHF